MRIAFERESSARELTDSGRGPKLHSNLIYFAIMGESSHRTRY